MLKIRLRRVGKKNQPSYRVVVVEHTAPVQGSYLELLGSYNPRVASFTVKQDRVLHWLNHGAQPSERIAKLLTTAGVTHKQIVLPDYDRKPKSAPKKAAQTRLEAAAAKPSEAAVPPEKLVVDTAEAVNADTSATELTPTEADSSQATNAEGGSTPEAEETATEETTE